MCVYLYRNMKGFRWNVFTVYVWVYIERVYGLSALYDSASVWLFHMQRGELFFFPASVFDGQ